MGSHQERVAVLTADRRKRRQEEMAALSSQNISALGYPRGAEISRERGKEEEVRAVQLRCLCVFWHKHQSGLPQQAPVSFWGAIVCSAWLTLERAVQHHGSEGDAQGRGETMLGEPSPVTAIPRRGSPLFVVFVAVGGSQFRVRTSLCLGLERLRERLPYPSDGTYGHFVSQPIPWESCLLCGDFHG